MQDDACMYKKKRKKGLWHIVSVSQCWVEVGGLGGRERGTDWERQE